MNESELVEFVYMAVGMGIVLQVYYPQILAWCLPPVAIIGAFYLVFGVLSKMTAGFFGHGQARRDDWWNGLAILSMVALWFGAPGLAVTAVQWIVSSAYLLIVGIFTIAL
jgi:hypothetical protein